MLQRKLRIDLSPLWNNAANKFVIRFRDLNNDLQRNLAQRIKTVAPQHRIRNQQKGPNLEKIQDALLEINPVIFSESTHQYYASRNNYQCFNKNAVNEISGWQFHRLCQAVYYLTCLKTLNLTRDRTYQIARLGCTDSNAIDSLLNQHFEQNSRETSESPLVNVSEIGMDEIGHARKRAEMNGANTLPAAMTNTPTKEGRPSLIEMARDLDGFKASIPNLHRNEESEAPFRIDIAPSFMKKLAELEPELDDDDALFDDDDDDNDNEDND